MMNLELGLGLAGLNRERSHASYQDLMACIKSSPAAADVDDHQNNVFLDQQLGSRLPPGWEQCLDLKSGALFYKNLSNGSTTHVDPRSVFALELSNSDGYSSHSRSSWKREYSLVQANNNKVSHANDDYDHGSQDYGCGYYHNYTLRPVDHRPSGESNVAADVDLDLRLSSSLHINYNSQPTSPSSSSSSSLASSSLHMNSQHSSHSCISDALQGPNSLKGMDCSKKGNHVHGNYSMTSGSVWSSTSSAPSAVSNWCKSIELDSDDENDKEDANTKMTTAACMRCLMFVLISSSKDEGMRCPLCGCDAMNLLHGL